ncbi:TPA: pyridoxal 5'-phosphate synthase glutaminase subunit PdxT [Candidatus Woesearchaeota archaeon]|nr:pyridoxal 5'-phosphate synthase glutaminase subunit PdxT [Candidatus Woesearchaeota archaeon]
MKIGVLALQGAFREHVNALKKCNVEAVEVRLPKDLEQIDGLIIPGGESTTMVKLMQLYELDKKIIEKHNNGMPIFGTCAGAIVVAKKISSAQKNSLDLSSTQFSLNLADIEVERNAYGRQIDSFEAELDIEEIGKFHGVFIRAPKMRVFNKEGSINSLRILAKINDEIVMARQQNILLSTFHPELTGDTSVHEYFIREFVIGNMNKMQKTAPIVKKM